MRFSNRFYAVAVLLALVACSHAAKVTTSGDATTVSNDQGAVTIGASADPAKVGAPMYPGATENPGSVVVNSANGSGSVASFKTTDAFDKVYDFYKSQLPSDAEKMKTSAGGNSMAMFSTKVSGSTDTVLVQVTSSDTGTSIVITRGSKP